MSLVLSCAFLLATKEAGPFETALSKISTAAGLTATFTTRNLNGGKATWTLKVQKPSRLWADSAEETILADDTQVTTFDKTTHRVSRSAMNQASFTSLLSRPELMVARVYFQSDATWLKRTTPMGNRTRDGVVLTGTQVAPSEDQRITFFVTPSESTVSLIQVDIGMGSSRSTHILEKIQITPATLAESDFRISLPADATDASEAKPPKSAAALRDEANGYVPYLKLTWEDFQIVQNADPMLAHTTGFIHYDYRDNVRRSGNGYIATVTEVEVRSGLDTHQTWRKRELTADPDRLLAHEQGHLDIVETQARKLRKIALGQWPTGSGGTPTAADYDLKQKLKKMFDEALSYSANQHQLYDSETDHGRRPREQSEWLMKIKREFDAAK